MATALSIFTTLLPIILLITKTVIENMTNKKAERDKLHADWADAVKSGDTARISDMLTRMRAFNP